MIFSRMHARIPMDHPSRVGEARRWAADLAARAGCDEVASARLSILVNELGSNLVRHAQGGFLLLGLHARRAGVEILSVDSGPGIADWARVLRDGYSTGGTPGTGLGAIQRQADEFAMHSSVPNGTVLVARVHADKGAAPPANSRFEAAGLSVALTGEAVCGDAWTIRIDGDQATAMVCDGLGHGPDAAAASEEALRVFGESPGLGLRPLLQQLHATLRSTRGAAVSLYQADNATGQVRTSGAGNVMGRIVSGIGDKVLLSQHGTAGVQMRTPDEHHYPWPGHALVVMHSDGIESRWKSELLAPLLQSDPAIAAAVLLREACRGRDDATVVVLKRAA